MGGFRFSAAMSAGILALGCSNQQSLMAPTDARTASLGAERVPLISPVFLGGDPSNPLAVQAGYEAGFTADDICPDNGEHADPGAQGQGIITPAGGTNVRVSVQNMNLVVYQYGEGVVGNICQLVGATILGIGTTRYTAESTLTGQGAFILHITLQGSIDLVSGGQARVNATAQVTILPNGTLLFDEERVRLTPL